MTKEYNIKVHLDDDGNILYVENSDMDITGLKALQVILFDLASEGLKVCPKENDSDNLSTERIKRNIQILRKYSAIHKSPEIEETIKYFEQKLNANN